MKLISVIGPTASGKTKLAVRLARRLGTDVISADSRQIYRGMDIGTGKDLEEYGTGENAVPYHLIDLYDAGYKYNLFEYQRDFLNVYETLSKTKAAAVLCGGSGLYIDAVVRGYDLAEVPPDTALRSRLEGKTLEELTEILATLKKLHNTSDTDTKKRAIRAIEIELYYRNNRLERRSYPDIENLYIGIDLPRDIRRSRIAARLRERLENGMVEEVGKLLRQVSAEDLMFYGLEYKFITLYLTGAMTYGDMAAGLETAIFQFAKRQMTFFRSMEKKGARIHWIDGTLDEDAREAAALELVRAFTNSEYLF